LGGEDEQIVGESLALDLVEVLLGEEEEEEDLVDEEGDLVGEGGGRTVGRVGEGWSPEEVDEDLFGVTVKMYSISSPPFVCR